MMTSTVKLTLLLYFFLAILPLAFAQAEKEDTRPKPELQQEQPLKEADSTELEEEACEVLLPSISETFEGRCKNGLAHGKGKATGKDVYEGAFKQGFPHGMGVFSYENGDVYTGSFKKGRMDGEGTLVTKINHRDTVIDGIWIDGVYAGPKPKHPSVTYKYGIDSYKIKKVRDGNRVLVDIYMNGMPNSDLENFTIVATSGSQLQLGRSIGFENITFPVICKLRYRTWNKLRTSRHDAIFEFKLEEPGDWKVQIIN